MKKQVHVSTSQGTMTKSRTLFSNFARKIDLAATRYRQARTALLRLDPEEKIAEWKEKLQELRREDIRGPSRKAKESSESRQEASWIWRTTSLEPNAGINHPELQPVMCVEFCKAVARAKRFREEVEIVVEEMRQMLQFFKWLAIRWERFGDARVGEPTLDDNTTAGLRAYAARQAALYRKLTNIFIQDWYSCLALKSLGSDWLSEYPPPEEVQRHRLASNVAAYHSTGPPPADTDEVPANNPPSDTSDIDDPSINTPSSDGESVAGELDDIEMELCDDL